MPLPVPVETVGGLACALRPEDLPEGASPRTYDTDFMTGRWYQRPGLNPVYSYDNAVTDPKPGGAAADLPVTGNAWTNPNNILVLDGNYAVCTPGAGSDALQVTEFAFNLPVTVTPTGILVSVYGFANSNVTLSLQLLRNGVPVGAAKRVAMPTASSTITLGGSADLWGTAFASSDVNNAGFGVQISASSGFAGAQAFLSYVTIQVAQTLANANFNYIKTFEADDGTVYNLAIDATGDWWVENVTANPGVLVLVMEGLTAGSFASSCTAQDGEFICFNDLTTGSDLPRKFTASPQTMDRVSQVGPGAPPVFSASSASATTYPIATITQPAAQARGFSYFLQSNGPGSNTAGNVVTVYYSDSTVSGPDNDLVTAFNSNQPVYLFFSFTGGPVTQGPVTVQVASVGLATPPGQPRQFYYFTYVTTTSAYVYYPGSGHAGYTANYQRTLATMTMSVPVPQLTVGSTAVVTGASVPAWDQTWTITQTPNSGAMAITQTTLTAGVATYSYAVATGANPVVGQLVTITGTLNANGMLNVVNTAIASVSGTNIGTFTVAGFSAATDYAAEAEDGQGTTAGTVFCFDPGLQTLGTSTSPIEGNSVGGLITVAGSGQFIGAGTRQGVLFFITENGFETAPSPPVTFTCGAGTTAINASQILIGPPNVRARGIAFTEAGPNGIPGANFYTIPVPVQYIVNGVTYTASALIINDNTSTTATFSFPDATLLAGTAIDTQGNDLFNLIELGNPAWVLKYASRNFYGECQNKLQNFLNLSFDGGYLQGTLPVPAGWTNPDQYGQLLVSPIFGNSYYIKNTTAGVLPVAGLISQSAYQDAYLVPILVPNVTYSVRVCARIPSGIQVGNLVVDLTANGISYGAFTLAFTAMSSSFAIYEGTLLVDALPTIPNALVLSVYAQSLGAGADLEVDRVEIFPTLQPVLQGVPLVSYANNLESVDANTGSLSTNDNNSQPCYGAAIVLEQLVLLKERSMYSTQDSPNYEPDDWDVQPISQTVGTCGVNGFDYGDEWLLTMVQSGVYGFNGGRPEPCSRELQLQNGPTPTQVKGLWESINWGAAKSFWLRNDIINRRFYCGVALPTPNFWLPNAPANPAPTQPNVILMCNYEACADFDELIAANPIHVTATGRLAALERRRKWSIWQIPSPYAAMIKRTTGEQLTLLLCNGIASGKIYELVPQQPTDDGVPIYPLYTSYGLDGNKQSTAPSMGPGRKLATYWSADIQGNGVAGLRFYPDTLGAKFPQTNPYALRLQNPAQDNDERKCEVAGQRIFIEISGHGDGQGGGGYVECGTQSLEMAPHPWSPKRGITL